jgi:SAM-dependent methyltransferase
VRRRSRLRRYNAWVWDRIKPYVGERVLEIGGGSGAMTRFLYGRELVVATDRETAYVDRLRNAFRRRPGIVVERADLESDDVLQLAHYNFDTVTAINVLEHTKDDVGALRRAHQLLPPGGRVIVFVPAGRSLFGSIDEGIGHQRRYEKQELVEKLQQAGFEVEHVSFQNRIAKMAWWMNAKLLGRRALPSGQSRVFDRLVPLFRAMEGDNPSSGLSLICVGRRAIPSASEGSAR